MKLKKVLTFALAAVLSLGTTFQVKATPSHKPQYTYWNTLVLILPDASVDNYDPSKRIVTTMHYSEIQKIQELAKNIEDKYGSGYNKINVDVKVDYDDLKSLSYSGISWNGVTPSDVASQLSKNAEYNQYDSILVVYRDVDNANNSTFLTDACYMGKNKESQNATFSTFSLSDGDHSMKYLGYRDYHEIDLLLPLLQSVYNEMSEKHPELANPNNFVDYSDLEKTTKQLNDYIYDSNTKGSLKPYLNELYNYHPSHL